MCTDAKTFSLRQVNTSNSLYVANTTHLEDDKDDPPVSGLQATAKSDFTLELSPMAADVAHAKSCIKALLPVCSSTGHWQSKTLRSKDELFADVPYSYLECQTAFEALACFELDEPKGCFVPSGQVKLEGWKRITEEAAELRVDLTGVVSDTQANNITLQATDLPKKLVQAVRDAMVDESKKEQGRFLDEQSCAAFLGIAQLETSTQGHSSTSLTAFLAAWKDLLPEKWRDAAKLEVLQGQYSLLNDGRDIALAGSRADQQHQGQSGKAAAADGKSLLGAKRKWHDKFRASKKTS